MLNIFVLYSVVIFVPTHRVHSVQLFVGKQENESLSPYLESNVCSLQYVCDGCKKVCSF